MDTIVMGNLCKDPILHQALRTGRPVAKFTVASHPRRWDGAAWVERPPVFHDVVCYGELAENVTNSLRTGMAVVAVGEWTDNSYTDELGHRRIRIVLEAKLVGPNLRWATADVRKTERRPKPDQSPLALATAQASATTVSASPPARAKPVISATEPAGAKPPEPIPVGTG